MNLKNIVKYSYPFQHWEFSNCLNDKTLNEIVFAQIPIGSRSYDGTRAADHTGDGIDGKLRLFVDKKNRQYFPHLSKFINTKIVKFM